jgi:hypothetical protein
MVIEGRGVVSVVVGDDDGAVVDGTAVLVVRFRRESCSLMRHLTGNDDGSGAG